MRYLGFLGGLFLLATLAPPLWAASLVPEPGEEQCSREGVRNVVDQFVHAYNDGRLDQLDEIWSEEPDFLGYWAVPERTHDDGENRSNLISYFEDRHSRDDRLVLKRFFVQEEREQNGSFDFFFEVVRHSEQRVVRGRYPGKGNAGREQSGRICALRVWNMVPLRYQQCSRTGVSGLVRDFIFAYNRGNVPLLDELIIAKTPEFETYTDRKAFGGAVPFSVSGNGRPVLKNFFDLRRRFHDRLNLTEFEVGRKARWGWRFAFELHRTADDILIPGGIHQVGEGAAATNCRIFVWEA